MLALSNKAAAIAKESVTKTQNEAVKKKIGPPKGGREWLEEMVTKQEILDRVGIVDPVIQSNVDSTLSTLSYKGKTKTEVTDDIVTDLEKQIEKLKYQRIKMTQGVQTQTSTNKEDELSKLYPEEGEFQRALKDKDLGKMEDLVERGRARLNDLQRKWQEKKELEQMKESGLLSSTNYQISSMMAPQESRLRKSSISNERKASVSPNSNVLEKNKMSREIRVNTKIMSQEDFVAPDNDLKNLLAKSEKLTMLDPKRVDFQNKLANYLTHKKLQEETSVFFEDKEKKKFERFRTAESYQKIQEFKSHRDIVDSPLTHLPMESKDEITKQMEKENRQNNFQNKEKVNKKKVHDINELFIIKLVFDALNHENKGYVSKEEALDYIMGNQEIITIFDLKSSFSGEALNFKGEKEGYLTFQELSKLMMKRLPAKTQSNIKSAFPQNKTKSTVELDQKDTLLLENELKIFRDIFDGLDQYEDLLIKTDIYLKALKNDMRVKQLMDKPAVKIPLVNRELTVSDIISQIEVDVTSAIEDGLNTMQYISWNQFQDYFKIYKASKFTRAQPNELEEQEMLLSENQVQIIQDVFDSVPRATEDYVDKVEFIKAVKRDPQINSFWKTPLEKNGKITADFFDEILSSDYNYLKWEEILPFFTKKGKNLEDEDEEGNKDFQGQTYKSEFGTFAPDHISEADKEDDSLAELPDEKKSPSRLNSPKKGIGAINEKSGKPSKAKVKDLKEFEELDAVLKKEYEQLQIDLRSYGVVKKNMKDEKGLTIPKPFKFNERDSQAKANTRQQKVHQMVEEKRKEEEDALNFKFRANPLPASVKIPMYGTLLKAQEERRMEVTEKSKQITLANQKPFSFYERDLGKQKSLPKEESFTQFKANPIPQSSKIEIFKEKEEQEKRAREERIKSRMEENSKSVKMPPRMEAHEKAKSDGTLANTYKNPKKYKPEEPTFKPQINRDVPDYEKQKQEFEGKLQQKKKERPKTEAKPFSFYKEPSESMKEEAEDEDKLGRNKKQQIKKDSKKSKQEGVQKREQRKPKKREEEQEEENQNEDEYAEDPDHNEENNEEREENNNEDENENENNQGNDDQEEEGGYKRRRNEEDEEEKGGDDNENMFQFEEAQEAIGDQAINPTVQHPKPQKKAQKEEEQKIEADNNNNNNNKTQELNQTKSSRGTEKPKAFLTKKLEQEFDRRKKDKEVREKRLEDAKKEEETRRKKEKEFAPKVQNAYKTVNKIDKREEQNMERIREAKDRMKREQEDYNEKIKEMKRNVETAPLMIEKKLYGSRLLNKYRDAINKGWQTLEGPVGDETSNSQYNRNTQSENLANTGKNQTRSSSKPQKDDEQDDTNQENEGVGQSNEQTQNKEDEQQQEQQGEENEELKEENEEAQNDAEEESKQQGESHEEEGDRDENYEDDYKKENQEDNESSNY